MPYQSLKGLKGKLIAVEGPDGVGRSTHIELIQEWLEVQGYGVLTTGWTRSELMSKTIASAKQGNILDPWSYSLLYATDFADRLEHQIIPALRSGFVVLADRYVYTAFARNTIRGCDRQWIRDVFGFAIVPDLVCYLRIDVDTLALRVIETKGMNYWESGMDMRLGADLYDSFKKYQGLIIEEFDKIAEEFGFEAGTSMTGEMNTALRRAGCPAIDGARPAGTIGAVRAVGGHAPGKGIRAGVDRDAPAAARTGIGQARIAVGGDRARAGQRSNRQPDAAACAAAAVV